MAQPTDRNLLIGVLALQFEFVTRDQLIDAMVGWAANKGVLLEDLFLEKNWIDLQTKEMLTGLIAKYAPAASANEPLRQVVEQHIVDRELLNSVCAELTLIPDKDVCTTLRTILPDDATAIRTKISEHAEPTSDANETLLAAGDDNPRVRFRIIRPHAKGGLGEVSVALDKELHRQVALKQIQPHYADNRLARQRFVLEAEVTAGLEHPGIVPVYGMGVFSDGRPYYAMRFIRGESLRDATDSFHKRFSYPLNSNGVLELRALLGRFIAVCQAIEYSHSRGILHRDLKPQNIMLGPFGETLVVDWGLAKTIDGEDLPASELPASGEVKFKPGSGSGSAPTELGSVIGTPAFMSPEQAAGQVDKIGTLSDVYSLGATLYYLITGQTAFDVGRKSENDTKIGVGRVLRMVSQGDFPPPREVNKGIPKALDTICLKAMSREPQARYGSPRQLAEDLERYLADEPLRAQKDSPLVAVLRWVRRHPALTSTVAAIVLVSSLGLAAFTTMLSAKQLELTKKNSELVVAQQQAETSAKEADARRIQAEDARKKSEAATEMANRAQASTFAFSEFLIDHILATARPKGQEGGLGIDVTVVEALRAAEPVIDTLFINNPEAEASTRSGIGRTWYTLGEYQRAKIHQQKVRELLKHRGPTDEQYLVNLNELSSTLRELGESNEAIQLQEQIVQAFRDTQGRESHNTILAENNLAITLQNTGRLPEAIKIFEHAFDVTRSLFKEDSPQYVNALNNLVGALRYGDEEQRQRAVQLFRVLLPSSEKVLGTAHPNYLITVNNYANFLTDSNQPEQAIALLEKTTRQLESSVGSDHPTTYTARMNLGAAYVAISDFERGLDALETAWKGLSKALTANHPDALNALDVYANALSEAGRVYESLEHFNRAYEGRKLVLGPAHLDTLTTLNNMATVYDQAQMFDRAIELKRECLDLRRSVLAPTSDEVMTSLYNLGFSYLMSGRIDEGIAAFAEHAELQLQAYGPDSPSVWEAFLNLASAYGPSSTPEKSIEVGQRALQMMQATLPPGALKLAQAQSTLGIAAIQAKQYKLARDQLHSAVSSTRAHIAQTDDRAQKIEYRGMLVHLATAEAALNNFDEAKSAASEAVELAEALIPDDWRLFNARSVLGGCLAATGELDAAEKLLFESHSELIKRQSDIPAPVRRSITLESFDRVIKLLRQMQDDERVATWESQKKAYTNE